MNAIKKIIDLAAPAIIPIVMEIGSLSAQDTFNIYHQLSEEGKCIRYYCFEPDEVVYNQIVNSHPDITSRIHISKHCFIGTSDVVDIMTDNTFDMFCEVNDIPYINLLGINCHIDWDDFYFGARYALKKTRYICLGEKADAARQHFEGDDDYEKVHDDKYTIFANKKLTEKKKPV